MLSSSRPTKYAATASRSRSSNSSGAARSAADNWAYASPHAWRPKDARRDEEEHEAMVEAELAKLDASAATAD